MQQLNAIKIISSFYEYYNAHNFEAMYQLFSEEVIYSINDYPSAVGKKSFIDHMQESVHNYREQLIEIIPMASQDGSFASARFRFLGRYFGDGSELGLSLMHHGQAYDLPGYNFFAITNGRITEIKAFFNEADLKKQILANEDRLAPVIS